MAFGSFPKERKLRYRGICRRCGKKMAAGGTCIYGIVEAMGTAVAPPHGFENPLNETDKAVGPFCSRHCHDEWEAEGIIVEEKTGDLGSAVSEGIRFAS